MPRELVHWAVLQSSIDELSAQGAGRVASILRNNREAAFLGAIAHDAPYYYQRGNAHFARVANGLHGLAGQDTFYPLRLLAQKLARQQQDDLAELGWAFLLGMFSHAITDQWFHPWIFFFSGDYYHPVLAQRSEARRRHRLLEVYLDDWLSCTQEIQNTPTTVAALLAELRGTRLEYLSHFLGDVVTENLFFSQAPRVNCAADWHSAFLELGLLQWGFRNSMFSAVIKLCAHISPERWAEVEALSNFGRHGLGLVLSGQHHYRNPVTGEPLQAELRSLFKGAVGDCARVFAALDLEIMSGVVPAILRTLRGVSLNYGVWGAGPEAAKFFSDTGLPLPGMQMTER
jgi:hypothetical protein